MADTRYYVVPGNPGVPDDYFRVASGGVYSTWNTDTRTWDHVTSKNIRDDYSRAIEGGDAVPTTSDDHQRTSGK